MNISLKQLILALVLIALSPLQVAMQPPNVITVPRGTVSWERNTPTYSGTDLKIMGDLNICGSLSRGHSPAPLRDQCLNLLAKQIIEGKLQEEQVKSVLPQEAKEDLENKIYTIKHQ